MKQRNQPDTTDYMACAGCFCLASRQAARKITRLCRTNSIRRRWRREFELRQEAVLEKLSILAQGASNRVPIHAARQPDVAQDHVGMEPARGFDSSSSGVRHRHFVPGENEQHAQALGELFHRQQ